MSLDARAFPEIVEPRHLEALRSIGVEKRYADGEWLWRAGDRDYACHFVEDGVIEIVEEACAVDAQPTLIASHGPGHFSGDVDLLSGRPAVIAGRAKGETVTIVIPPKALRDLVRLDGELGAILLDAMLARREILMGETGHGIRLFGSAFDPDTLRAREFLTRNHVLHTWHRPDTEDLRDAFERLDLCDEDLPAILANGRVHRHVTPEGIGEGIGIRQDLEGRWADLVVIGAGPAGLAAAVYGASEGLDTVLLDARAPGGQASWSSRIENYMGFPTGITGEDLANAGRVQAEKFGATLSVPTAVRAVECGEGSHRVVLDDGSVLRAKVILVSAGATYRKLDAPGFEKYEGRGIYYAATATEVEACRNSEVVVVGAGNSAGQAVVFLSTKCEKVRLVVRGDDLRKSMSAYLVNRIEKIPNVEVLLETEVAECCGGDTLDVVVLKGKTSGRVPCAGLFTFVGATPNTDFLDGKVARDRHGFVITGEDVKREGWPLSRSPQYLETSCPGILAAGDCRAGSVKRVASAVGEGSMAVAFAHAILAS